MIRKIIKFIKDNTGSVELSFDTPEGYKRCPACGGTGHEDVHTLCPECDEGFIKMSYQEYVDSLPEIKND